MRKLSKDITPREMMELRRDGFSNKEIAEKLGCCYATVLKYIGAERKQREWKPFPGEVVEVIEPKKPEKMPECAAIEFKGEAARIRIDFASDSVAIVNKHGTFALPAEYVGHLIKDLQKVEELAKKVKGIDVFRVSQKQD